jgi:hypothetical protein
MATKGDFIQTTRQNKRVYILKEDIFAITQQQSAMGSSVYCRSLDEKIFEVDETLDNIFNKIISS